MTDEAAIRALIDHWHAATRAGNVPAVLALIDEHAEFLAAGREPMRGRAAFEASLRGVLATHRLDTRGDVREVQVSGDLAFAITHLSIHVVPLDGRGASTRSGDALSIFRRSGDGWRLIRDANLLAPAG